ncbi:NAD(P)/FAD-dependent oxidoreductase [Salinicola corii]|nr:FAD-binding oxidoreductase [Salinicola corii]
MQQDSNFDMVVIGGGFTGLAAVRRYAENNPSHSVLLIEALKVGQGVSGRNSGFVIDLPHKRELELGDKCYLNKVMELNRVAIDYLEAQVNTYDINCQWSRVGKYQAAVGNRGIEFLAYYKSLLNNVAEEYEDFTGDCLENIFGTTYYQEAVYTPGGALMQPAALVRGLVDNMPVNVTVSERSPVIGINKRAEGFTIRTSYCTLHCGKVILATNAFTKELGFMKNRILPVMTFASWTRPLTATEMEQFGGQLDWGITPADHGGTTLRVTQDRRILIRNGYRYAFDYNTPPQLLPKLKKQHRRAYEERYPGLAHIPFTHTWGGASSLSGNFETYFGKLDDNLYSAGCDQSVGASRGTISGMMLADYASGIKHELLDNIVEVSGKPSRLPPEAILRLVVPLRMQMQKFRSRSEI